MEVIVDELQKNGIRIDMTLLNIHVNRILEMYKAIYDEATSRLKAVDQLVDVFHENCFNTVARVMAYLTLIRCMNLPKEEDVRKAVRLVVPSKEYRKSGWNNEFKESANCTRDFYTYALFQYWVYTHGHYIIDGKFKNSSLSRWKSYRTSCRKMVLMSI